MFSEIAMQEALHKGLTVEQSQRLQEAKVAIVGLGGLGSNVAMWLARLGVGHLLLYDFDKVELSNLNRQYYFLQDVGEYKAVALLEYLRQVNPYGDYQSKVVRLTEANLAELVGEADIVCEALDKPEAKALLVNGVLENFPDKDLVAAWLAWIAVTTCRYAGFYLIFIFVAMVTAAFRSCPCAVPEWGSVLPKKL